MLYAVVEELISEIGLYGGGIFSAGEKRGILNAMNRNGSKKDEDCEMNIKERATQAAAWKAAGQCNCAQAVLKAFEDKLPVDADTSIGVQVFHWKSRVFITRFLQPKIPSMSDVMFGCPESPEPI